MRVALALILFLGVGPTSRAQAQDTTTVGANAGYVEVLGNGGLFSVNYERMLSETLGVRVGVSNWMIQDRRRKTVTTFPLTVTILPGGWNGGLELGGGLVLGNKKEEERDFPFDPWLRSETTTIVDLTGVLGYRWIWPSGWLVRLAFTPFLALSGDYPDEGFSPSVGISVGRVF
jgi:hypothetical protein